MFAKIIATVTLIISLLFQSIAATPVKHSDDVQLKAVLISDIHADADPTRDRTDLMRQIFAAIGQTQRDADTIVMSGDLTNSGDQMEYINLINSLNLYCKIRDKVPEMGNHDSWHHSDDPDYSKAERYFKRFCSWCGIRTDKVYYSKQVNGVPFIVLGVEACDFDDPYHSDEQLDWFESELTAAVAGDKPVFVVCHKPIEDVGDAAERMEAILTAAAGTASAPIIYVSGHNHMEICEATFTQPADKLIYLNLPSFEFTGDGGLGFVAEIGANEVKLTGMDFLKNEPVDGAEYVIEF